MKDLEKRLKEVSDVAQVQFNDPASKTDPYMRGMANGMIFILASLNGVEPRYINAPGVNHG